MIVYRSPMEKILDQNENDTVITNPGQPVGTLWRKILYRLACWKERLHKQADRRE